MLYGICGKPREGKTQFAVSLIMKQLELNAKYQKKIEDGGTLDPEKKEEIRPVYADIDGLNLNGVIKSPDDWRDVPDGSVIFYDEVHFRKEYEFTSSRPSQNPMIKELTIHGHRNIDIYLITQDFKRVEHSTRNLLDAMYYVKRPQNKPPFATVYVFDKYFNDPYSAANAGKHHDSYIFKYHKKYYEAYTSASAHTSMSFKIQRKFIYAGIAIIIMMGFAIKLFLASGFIDIAKKATDTEAIKSIGKAPDLDLNNDENTSISKNSSNKTNGSTIKSNQDHEVIRVASVIVSGNQCVARNGYGEVISYNEPMCFEYAKNPGIYMSSSRNPRLIERNQENTEVITSQQNL